MKQNLNWLISGVASAICFIIFTFVLKIPFWGSIPLAVGIFVGMLFIFKPSETIVDGINISNVSSKNKAENLIKKWTVLTNQLTVFKTENAYLQIKTAQLYDDAHSVFYKINENTDRLYTAEKYLEKYLRSGLLIAEKYEKADKAEETVSKGNYGEIKEKLREYFDNMIDYFHENFEKLTDNDVRIINEFLEILDKSKAI